MRPPPDTLDIDITPEGTIRLAGELDAANASRLHTALDSAPPDNQHCVIIDVTRLGLCDASGLAALVRIRHPTQSQTTHPARRVQTTTATPAQDLPGRHLHPHLTARSCGVQVLYSCYLGDAEA